MPRTILEVIALDAADARAAFLGGADRLELVSGMDHGGLTPSISVFEQVSEATSLPVRVMLRSTPGYALTDPAPLIDAAAALRAAGASEFVLGFLSATGDVDRSSVSAVVATLAGCRWTFHRAIDHARDRTSAWSDISDLPGMDTVLTSGAAAGISSGLPILTAEAPSHPQILAGGGLQPDHVAPLHAAGVRAFHIGSGARPGGSWTSPVDPALVRAWRDQVDSQPVVVR